MYYDLLKSFIRQRVDCNGEWLELNFTWSPHLLELVMSPPFFDFQWLGLRSEESVRVFGIRRLLNDSFIHLSDLEFAGFNIETRCIALPVPPFDTAERYVIAALESAEALVIYDCVHPSPDTWFVQVEHTLRKRPPRD